MNSGWDRRRGTRGKVVARHRDDRARRDLGRVAAAAQVCSGGRQDQSRFVGDLRGISDVVADGPGFPRFQQDQEFAGVRHRRERRVARSRCWTH